MGRVTVHPRIRQCLTVCVACAACWAVAAAAQQTAAFTGERGGEMVRLNATVKTYQGVTYVSLSQLAEQLGGKARLDGTRVEVTLEGSKAVGTVNDTGVSAAQGPFALAHPMLTEFENAYIPLDDAVRFFDRAFHASLAQNGVSATTVQAIDPSTPEEAPAETEDPKTLLKTLELAPPPTAAAPPAETAPGEPSPEAPPVTAAPAVASPEAAVPAAAPVPAAPVAKGPIRHVAVDAGHGGGDTGTIGPNGTAEKAVTAALAAIFEKDLAATGTVSAAVVRREDREMSASDRAAAAGSQSAGLLVSLHAGAALSPQSPQIQIYHAPIPAEGGDLAACATRAKALAEALARALAAEPDPPSVAVHAIPLRLQTAAKMPCLLLELGALNQAEGEALLVSEEQRAALTDRLAKALAAAVADVNAQR